MKEFHGMIILIILFLKIKKISNEEKISLNYPQFNFKCDIHLKNFIVKIVKKIFVIIFNIK